MMYQQNTYTFVLSAGYCFSAIKASAAALFTQFGTSALLQTQSNVINDSIYNKEETLKFRPVDVVTYV